MQRILNIFRILEWKLRYKLNLKGQTVAPVVWKGSKLSRNHRPSSRLLEELDEQQKKRISTILKEAEIISSFSDYFPTSISDEEWKVMLECQTRKQRFDQFMFLHKIGILRENRQKERMKDKQAEKIIRDYNLLLKPTRNQKIYEWFNVLKSFRIPAPTLVVDCQFLSKLSHRGLQLTAQQMQYLNSENKELEIPFRLYFANYDRNIEAVKRLEKSKLAGINSKNNILPIVSSQCFSELFDNSKIVYLSPDGEEVLEDVESDKVYVIGGIVDRVLERGIDKNASFLAAKKAGVKCCRLPIDENIDFKSGSKFLTFLAVMNILSDVNNHGDWKKAMERWIPRRNTKKAEEKNIAVRDHHGRIREFNRRILRIVELKLGKDG